MLAVPTGAAIGRRVLGGRVGREGARAVADARHVVHDGGRHFFDRRADFGQVRHLRQTGISVRVTNNTLEIFFFFFYVNKTDLYAKLYSSVGLIFYVGFEKESQLINLTKNESSKNKSSEKYKS